MITQEIRDEGYQLCTYVKELRGQDYGARKWQGWPGDDEGFHKAEAGAQARDNGIQAEKQKIPEEEEKGHRH